MKTFERPQHISGLSALAAVALAFAAGALVAGMPSAPMAAPDKKDCSDATEYPDVFARVKCRHDAVADQLAYTADEAYAPGTALHGRLIDKQSRLAHIGNSGLRGKRAKQRRTAADFKKMAKSEVRGNRKGGHLVPLIDALDDTNGDGICDYEQGNDNAQCAAIELDEFGERQACNPKKKNKGKGKPGNDKFEGLECDLSFDPEEAATADEEDQMQLAAEELESTLGAVEDDLAEMNTHLDNVNSNLPAFAGFAVVAAEPCDLPAQTPGLSEAVAVLRGLTAAAQGASAIADSSGGQTVVFFGSGGNGRSFATIANAAAMAVELSYITLDEIASAEAAALQAATMACVSQVAGQVAALQALMMQEHAAIQANDDANTAAIQTRLTEVEAALSRLLNTPQGQRDAFPVK